MASVLREYGMFDPLVGDVKMSIQNEDHKGWVKCDGRLVDIKHYGELYHLIGGVFGISGDTHFRVPNPAGRVLGVIGSGLTLTSRSVGDVVGEERHLLTIPEMPSHSHGTNSTANLGLMTNNGSSTMNASVNDSDEANLFIPPTQLLVNTTGGSQSHNVMQPTMFMGNVFIFSGVLFPC